MERQRVASSNIRSVGYDPDAQVLEIEFQDGAVYQYSGVPSAVYAGLLSAGSAGRYSHAHIKGRYPHRKVE
jgi:hypothetical protein